MFSRNCQYYLRRMHKTCEITCPCSRDTGHARRRRRSSSSRKIRPDRLSPRTISGLSDRTRPIDLSRARDVARTARHARHARHATRTYAKRDNAKTSNSELEFPVGEPSVIHPNLRPRISVVDNSCTTDKGEDCRAGTRAACAGIVHDANSLY